MARLLFRDERFLLPAYAEFFVRLIVYSWYVVFGVITLLLILSAVLAHPPAFNGSLALGLLFALFLGDRLLHYGEGEHPLYELNRGAEVNLAVALTPSAFRLVHRSFRKALGTHESFELLLLKELVERGDIREALRRLDVPAKDFLAKIEEYLGRERSAAQTPTRADLLTIIGALVEAAYQNAEGASEKFIEPRNLLFALGSIPNPSIQKLFELFNITAADIGEAIIFGKWGSRFARLRSLPATLGGFANHRMMRHRVMNRAWTARPTPTLDRYSADLTDLAREESIGFLIGHTKEYDHLLQVVSRPGMPNAILVGESGSGKSSLVAHLAYQIVKDQVPPVLFDKRLVSLRIADLTADAPAEVLTGRLEKIADEILKAGNIVLHLPNMHDLFRTGGTRGLDAIDILLPIIKSTAIPVIGDTFPREFKQYIETRSDFLEQFEVVPVEEISEAEALRFLIYSSLMLEKEYKVLITFRALKKAVEVAHRYFKPKLLPGSAVDLVKQALAKASQEHLVAVNEDVVVAVAERQSKIPIERAGAAEAEKLLDLESTIHQRLVDQEAAVKAVAQALREYRSGLARRGGPIATFLFVGPTGVGKTELAKILAETQFGSKDAMTRLDMTEYQDKQSIFRLIGNPDGSRSGALTDAVLARPYCLVLLDEFEKASPDVLNLFLQVFDDGRLTDSLGRTVNFENTILIATSNAHSDYIKTEIEKGRTSEDLEEDIKRKLTDYFKPELLNRFSNIIVFRSLKLEEIHTITKLLLQEIAMILSDTQGITLEVDEDAVKRIAELGYSPAFGARPLRQTISENVRSALAEKILRKEIGRGNTIRLVYADGRFDFKLIA